jgi:ATP-dependent Clp protease ATP-binding subunit ClpA
MKQASTPDLAPVLVDTKTNSGSPSGWQAAARYEEIHWHPEADAVVQEFEKAGELRDREVELKAKIDAIVNDKKAKDDAESDAAGDGGPVVNDTDIANIVAQWTGTPHERSTEVR